MRTLEPVKPYEFGAAAGLLPNYLKAISYLNLAKAQDAIAEFKAVSEHRGVDPMAAEWILAQLGLARTLRDSILLPRTLHHTTRPLRA